MELIAKIMEAWGHYKFSTEVLVASVRKPEHVERAARLGAHICTIPYEVFLKLPEHPLTEAGIKKFLDDWGKVGKAS
jgi:transaldolase